MNELEKQLRSWTPRAPSDKIARQLFPERNGFSRFSFWPQSWNWVAPVMACFVTMLVSSRGVDSRGNFFVEPGSNAVFATVALSSLATSNLEMRSEGKPLTLTKVDLNLEWNVWSKASFESTNRSQSPSSIGSLPFEGTNNSRL